MPKNDESPASVDIREDSLLALSAEVLDTLLRDHTTGMNIFWATHDYESLGSEYDYHSQILPELITGEHGMVIRPRVLKSKEKQTDRSKDMAEVFTPSWICDAQNNLVEASLLSPKGEKDWMGYVRTTCLEITCGEAPYLVSRYDATTGEPIPLEKRIGLLDRKLRVVSKNTKTPEEWLEWAEVAYMNIYGYEWQGDNLLLARQNLLFSFIEYYQSKFATLPPEDAIHRIAEIISWNLWQMDGLRGVPPDYPSPGELHDNPIPDMFSTYCVIRDWDNNKEIRYIDLINT
ncbi:MAG: restriction endonuclease subunit M [Bacteroidaceae bacterium]|nr:restriction endonuclease subunit M [Bacteroidaceae bacterium]